MSTTTPLTDSINALTMYANSVTGQSDTDLSAAVATLASGYGGGSMGGLANVAEVTNQDYSFAYMLTCMANGATAGGTMTATTYANSEQLLLSTGLTTLHGFMFVGTSQSFIASGNYAQSLKFCFVTINSDSTFNMIGVSSYSASGNNVVSINISCAQGTNYSSLPVQGALRFDGGDIYYTARYNNNSNYQLLQPSEFDWLAW